MTANLRNGDIACRIGGDEFVLVLPDCTADQAKTLVNRLCGLIKRLRVRHDDRPLEAVTLSAGVSEAPMGASCTLRLLRGADEALYAAKRAGGDRVVVNEWPHIV
jgi:diguanylate cyclase (GGDEF)-like protein